MSGTILLRQVDQGRLNFIISNFAKTQQHFLKFSEVMMLLLDRCIFCNKFTLGDFYNYFNAALKVPLSKPLDKQDLQGQKYIGRQQLIFLFHQISKKLFKPDPSFQQKFYNTFLSEMVTVQNDQINRSRVMVFDQTNKKLLVQPVVQIISQYEEQLKNVFIAYTIENYWTQKKAKRLLLSMRQIILQNKKWSFTSLIFYLKQSQTTPHLISIEHVQEFLRLIVPNTNGKQQQFYSRRVLSDCYHKQNQNNQTTSHAGDPGIVFFQFELLFARIAWDSYPRELQKKNISDVMKRYFKYLLFRPNDKLDEPFPTFNRKMITKMKEYYKLLQTSNQKSDYKKNDDKEQQSQVNLMAKKMDKQIMNAPQAGFDFRQAIKTLERDLPKMPPLPKVVKEDPNDFITIGMQPPPQPVDKNQKAQKQEKKEAKKDEIPQRVFKWADVPQVKMAAEDFLKNVVDNKLTFEVKPLTDIQRGTINRQGYPVLIGQILFPPELPKNVVPWLKAATNAMSDRNYYLALDNYNQGMAQWKKTTVQFESTTQLFFEHCKGNVYLSAGKLQYALQIFYSARKFSDTSRLPFSNPDRSLPYYGLGQVLFQMEQYQLAARSFLKARQIRQSVLGIQHVQTASTFNNLACCFFMLGRSHEALGYCQIAEVVIDSQLGSHHQRTMTCRNNLKKIQRGTFDNQPQFRKMWQVFQQDKFQKKKKKKGADQKKKK